MRAYPSSHDSEAVAPMAHTLGHRAHHSAVLSQAGHEIIMQVRQIVPLLSVCWQPRAIVPV